MNEWYTAKELAGLPGMPGTERAVLYRAHKKNWPSCFRCGRGGGRKYHISALPKITRMHIVQQAIEAAKKELDRLERCS